MARARKQTLSRALRDDRETQPSVIRAVLRVAGLRLVAVDDDAPIPSTPPRPAG